MIGPVALASSSPRIRPRSLSELLDAAFSLYRRNFTVVAGLSLLVSLPYLLALLATGAYRFDFVQYYTNLFQNPAAVQSGQFPLPSINASALSTAYLVALIVAPFTTGALFRAGVGLQLGEPLTIGQVLLDTLRRYFGLWGAMILFGLVAISSVFVITIPIVLWVLVRWSLGLAALFAERVNPARALGRSWALVKDQWWRTLGIILVVLLLTSIVSGVLTLFLDAVAVIIPSTAVRGVILLTSKTVVSALVSPITPITVTLLYFDLRVRNEGYDLEQLARQASGSSPA
jgi:hypothetical protein